MVCIPRFILLISSVLQLVRPQRLAEAAASDRWGMAVRVVPAVVVGLLPLRIELFRSNEFYPAKVLLSLHNMHLCRHSLNFAHVPVVDAGHLPIVPGNRDRVPSRFGDNAAIGGVTSPENAGADLQVLGFGDCHCCCSRLLQSCPYYGKQRVVSFLLVLHCFTSACGQLLRGGGWFMSRCGWRDGREADSVTAGCKRCGRQSSCAAKRGIAPDIRGERL